MKKILFVILLILLSSCSNPYYLVYRGDIYLDNEHLYTDVLVLDKQKENEIFFYDSSRTGHLLMGNVSVKNCTDTTSVKM